MNAALIKFNRPQNYTVFSVASYYSSKLINPFSFGTSKVDPRTEKLKYLKGL